MDLIARSPLAGIDTPKREQRGRNYLTPEEYSRLLAAAGGHPRDFALLTLFLQTGIRISELCALELEDIDTKGRTLRVREGKGQSARTVELEKKGAQAVTSWLRVRPETLSEALFLGRDGEPLKEWGVRDLLAKYCAAAGIKKAITPHSLRHTFASYKAERGVSCPGRLLRPLQHPGTLTEGLPENQAGRSKRPGQRLQRPTAGRSR